MIYVIDIDGTICVKDKRKGYEMSVPMMHRINMINDLYDKGHYIKYFTARGMGRHQGNASMAFTEFYVMTSEQLRKWGCKYHELILGKPAGDIYIDDKGINDDGFFS